MKKFLFLSDQITAETTFVAYGENLNLLFKNAALALTEVMVDTSSIAKKVIWKIKLTSDNLEELLLRFLEEIIYLKDSQGLVFKTFNIHVINTRPVRLSGELGGEKIDSGKHKLRTDIKAVTHHMFELKKEQHFWKANVVVDV